ncbi:MAG: aconitate hydratase AcnA, partial [Microvirga sp.]
LEYVSQCVWTGKDQSGETVAYPDTLVGTDSHTTMVNGLGVLGWGVGGIEAEAAMLGQPVSMLIPEVVGFRLAGELKEGITATDLVLTVTQLLRQKGVVGRFVEFYGPGLDSLTLADRATIGNMAPEYGATCGFFPIDQRTVDYLELTGRDAERIALVKAYTQAQGLWRDSAIPEPVFTDTIELDLTTVEPSLAGPKRPQDRVPLRQSKAMFRDALTADLERLAAGGGKAAIKRATTVSATPELASSVVAVAPEDAVEDAGVAVEMNGARFTLRHGSVVIAAITSCTNTSNPSVMLGAGLLARNAVAKGLSTKPWVKTSCAPGSKVVTDYYQAAGLMKPLEALGFHIVGYGCTTCIGNSGPLPEAIAQAVEENKLVVAAVLSGNRNFEGRVNPDVRANYLASPPLVVAYALAGSLLVDLVKEPLGTGGDGKPVYLKDIWPTNTEIQHFIERTITGELFKRRYSDVFTGDSNWKGIPVATGLTYEWPIGSTYVQNPPYFEGMTKDPKPLTDIVDARILGLFGDSITTDHISPAGNIRATSPAGKYLLERQVPVSEFNQYGTRRGNHEIMERGTFANIRIKNQMVKDANGNVVEGGYAIHWPDGQQMFIFDAAMKYKEEGVPLVVFAGKEYGTGSSRDWAAKGTNLLGIRAVVAESFERIHRSNLVGMGVMPLVFVGETSWASLGLKGDETVTLRGIAGELKPRQKLTAEITSSDGKVQEVPLVCRIDTLDELEYFRNGGILQYVLRQLAA